MIAYHVTSAKKLARYSKAGGIKPPVRAWRDLISAGAFSIQTGRRLIVRLRLPDDTPALEGHHGAAVVANSFVRLESM